MTRHGHRSDGGPPVRELDTGGVALGALLETERQLTALVEAAAVEGRDLVESARKQAADLEADALVDLQAALTRLDDAARLETDRAIEAAAAAARAEVARFDAVPDDVVAQLADEVLLDFLGRAGPGKGGAP